MRAAQKLGLDTLNIKLPRLFEGENFTLLRAGFLALFTELLSGVVYRERKFVVSYLLLLF